MISKQQQELVNELERAFNNISDPSVSVFRMINIAIQMCNPTCRKDEMSTHNIVAALRGYNKNREHMRSLTQASKSTKKKPKKS